MGRRILILGGEGMLGHKMWQLLRDRFEETFVTLFGDVSAPPLRDIGLYDGPNAIGSIDVNDFTRVLGVLEDARPDVVVNCIGVIKQRPEAKDAVTSITLNSLLPHQLAAAGREMGFRVIHFSTDCVFSGTKGQYTEDDTPDAGDLYGRSKLLGEVTGDNAITLRTSIIGREIFSSNGLLEWFLSQAGNRIKGYRRAFYSGVTTNLMATIVGELIERHADLSGLYHVTAHTIAKYDLLCLIRDAFGVDVEIEPDDDFFCDRSMIGDRFRSATGYECPPWPELVDQLAQDSTPYDVWKSRPPEA